MDDCRARKICQIPDAVRFDEFYNGGGLSCNENDVSC